MFVPKVKTLSKNSDLVFYKAVSGLNSVATY